MPTEAIEQKIRVILLDLRNEAIVFHKIDVSPYLAKIMALLPDERRWREFITWWNGFLHNYSYYTKDGIMRLIDGKIDEI